MTSIAPAVFALESITWRNATAGNLVVVPVGSPDSGEATDWRQQTTDATP